MSHLDLFYNTPAMEGFKRRVDKVIQLRNKALEIEDPQEQKKELGANRRLLDSIFWDIIAKMAIDGPDDGHKFSSGAALSINFGLLCLQQLDVPDDVDLEEVLLKLSRPKPKDKDNVYWLSEWMHIWETNANLYADKEKKELAQQREEWIDDEKASKYQTTRTNIYRKLLPTLKGLPGININFLRSLLAGEIDRQTEICKVTLHHKPQSMDAGARRTLAIYSTLMKQLLSACHDSESRKLVLILEKIHQSMVKRRLQQQVSAQPEVQTTSTEAKHRHLEKEMRLVKSCLPIGGMEGREFFTTPILNQSQPLLDKSKVSKALETLYECDPYLPQDLPVLMVPFRGSGFFEFDNNTLIVPISPTFPAEEVVFRASANYRLLTDQLQHKGEIKRNYEKLFDGNRFKENFLKDYVQWMTRISKGHRKIMPLKKFDFFSSYIGPDPKSLLASPEIKFMPKPQLRRQLNELMGGETSQAGYIRIATIYWHLDDKAKALKYAEEALTAGMPNPKLLLIYGYTLKARGDAKKAQQMFKNCQRLYKNSLWGAYAQRELES